MSNLDIINIIEIFKNTVIKSQREFNLEELLIILTEIYNELYNNKKKVIIYNDDIEDDDIPKKIGRPKKIKDDNKLKRKPSAYNAFIAEKYNEVKKDNPDKNAKDIMKLIAELWKEHKLK
jgi:hypothetical protein